jgi:hypothetical protein
MFPCESAATRRLRTRFNYLALGAVLALSIALGGCSDPGPLSGGTPVGNQTITITGTATNGTQSVTHASTVKLQVKSLF